MNPTQALPSGISTTPNPRLSQVLRRRFKLYQELAKSGIVTLVLISVLGGYLIGHPFESPFQPLRLLATLVGILFLASGSSALNQLQEWRIDVKMPRTAKRPIPSGKISPREAAIFVITTLTIGLVTLWFLDPKVFWLGALAVLSYNGLYTLWWKKDWAFAAVPGALPGALPILMGYAAADGSVFTAGGLYLFALLFFWQMPHFWVLAIRYRSDYAQGGFPTLPVAHGTSVTVVHVVMWCLAYVALALWAPIFLHVGAVYYVPAFFMSIAVLISLRHFVAEPEGKRWLKFFLWVNFSLIVYIGAAVTDLWSVYLVPYLTR